MKLGVYKMRTCKYFEAKGIDYKGQLQKIPKASTKLQPLFESLTNAIEAIKLSNNENKNEIIINLFLTSGLFSDSKEDCELSKIVIEDFGIGFNDKEFDRFTKLHDNSKGFTNQGSGRIQYMHFFDETKFESTFRDNNSSTGFYKRVFWLSKSDTFLVNKAIICFDEPIEIKATEAHTKITFMNFLDEEDKKYFSFLSSELLKEKFIEHYLYYFCENRGELPKIQIKSFINDTENKVSEITLDDIPHEDKHEEITIQYKKLSEDCKFIEMEEKETFHIKSFKLNKEVLDSNDLKLTSKHEIVRGKFNKKFELNILKPEDIIDEHRYLFLVSSSYIDNRDTDNRGELEIYTNEEYKNDSSLFKENKIISLDDIQTEINSHILTMYSEISNKREQHSLDVDKLQKMFLLDKKTLKGITVNVQDTDEDILKKVYKADAKRTAEKDAKLKEEIEKLDIELNEFNPIDPNYEENLSEKISSLVEKIPLQNKVELTQYVARRKLVLDLFSKILDRELKIQHSTKKQMDEKLLHNLIFKQSSDNPNESDLWLVNEEFIYFKGTSEGTLGDIKVDGKNLIKDNLTEEETKYRLKQEGDAKLKRPDILLFPNEGKCIIIELKAPKVSISDHLNQLNMYASLINNLSKDEYKFNTFYGYLIGENIDIDDVEDKDSDFKEACNFNYMYRPYKRIAGKFDRKDGSLYTEVIKYSTLLERAQKRNEVFISKLGC